MKLSRSNRKKLSLLLSRPSFSRPALSAGMGIFLVLGFAGFWIFGSHAIASYPTTPPAQICGSGVLSGPASAPAGAITVPAGDNSGVNFSQAGATYWFAPGTHTLGAGMYSQITPANNTTYIGGPGAVLDGKNLNNYAFTQHATPVTIKYLTIQNFGAAGANNNEGVVNHDAGAGWTISYNTIQGNAGAGVFIGSNDTITYNCIRDNGQYGFSSYDPNGLSNVLLDHNEISGNNTYDWESKISGCGCTGGGKFWDTTDATITNNWIHNNKSVGLWADTNNVGFQVEGNYISDNDAEGFFYEISYNASVKYNNFLRNGLVKGPTNPGFPTGAIYLSEAGGDSRVANTHGYSTIEISDNAFTDNWSGVIEWENADRFCNSPANTSGTYCTKTGNASLANCVAPGINSEPLYSDCRWKTKNVSVHNNTFSQTPANIGPGCTLANSCGLNAIFSNYGTYPAWSPYTGTKVQTAITYNQNNTFTNNTYSGTWGFMPFDQSAPKTFAQWRGSPYNQDAGSTLNGSTPAPTATGTPGSTPTPTGAPTPTPAPTGTPGTGATKTFESGTDQMQSWYNSAVSRSTVAAHAGAASLAVTASAAGGWGIEETWPGSAVVTPGTSYDIAAWAKAGSTARALTMSVTWLDAADAPVGTAVTASASDATSSWTKIAATATAPAGAAHALFRFTSAAGAAAEVHYLDDVSIAVPAPAGKVGDLNGDNAINVFDLSILLSKWSQANAGLADLNHDGTVNVFDLSILLVNWGK